MGMSAHKALLFLFQFLNGAIRMLSAPASNELGGLFQFLNGAIRIKHNRKRSRWYSISIPQWCD